MGTSDLKRPGEQPEGPDEPDDAGGHAAERARQFRQSRGLDQDRPLDLDRDEADPAAGEGDTTSDAEEKEEP